MSLDAWVLDLECIVDACGLDRFPLLGISQGCAVCIEYAARHPDRVSALILHGGYAAGWRAIPTFGPAEIARRDASIEIVRHGWGEDTPAYRQMFTQTFIPGGTPEEIEWFNELQRRTVSPENAAASWRRSRGSMCGIASRKVRRRRSCCTAAATADPLREGSRAGDGNTRRALRAAGQRQSPDPGARAGVRAVDAGGAAVPRRGR
jgi:pimeloyl-ACP methyl ester carboxylesterase